MSLSLGYTIFQNFSRENNIANAKISADNANAQIKDQRLLAQQTIATQLGAIAGQVAASKDEAGYAATAARLRVAAAVFGA